MAETAYHVPEGTLPLLSGVLEAMDFVHRDMMRIVTDLPTDALAWQPGPAMGSLSGIVRHTMYAEVFAIRMAAGEEVTYDEVYNAGLWEATDAASALVACITEGDVLMKRILPVMTVERMAARYFAWGQSHPTLSGALIAEAVSHTSMHWGHMQMTRQMWEQAHPEFSGAYERG